MPTVTIKFNLPEEQEEHKHAMEGSTYHLALWEIANEVFRPARKHGYSDPKIQRMIDWLDERGSEENNATELISLLESRFYEILNERSISIN